MNTTEKFVCLDCFSHLNQNEGTVTNNQGFSEFICNSCSTKSACGACGEWAQSAHNCSEKPRLAECANCLTDFDPFKEGKVSDSPNLGGIVAFCGKCWKREFARRNGGK